MVWNYPWRLGGEVIPAGLFDRIVVISLPASVDRRQHIRQHFADIGIDDYAFFNALDSRAPEVSRLFEDGKVAQYPPCFRCGKLECGKKDCNNVLIPVQVAVFATYLALWREIAATNHRVLVCEDDVLFHPWAGRVLKDILQRVLGGRLTFTGAEPGLLRLGWALGPDHDAAVPFQFDRSVRMSNPCHAITGAYARALLHEFALVDHTADVYQHSSVSVSKTHAVTILPPIASELSSSVGSVESLIHPKEKYALHLERNGNSEAASEYRERIFRHVHEVAHKNPE